MPTIKTRTALPSLSIPLEVTHFDLIVACSLVIELNSAPDKAMPLRVLESQAPASYSAVSMKSGAFVKATG